jgi:hypothetical protein
VNKISGVTPDNVNSDELAISRYLLFLKLHFTYEALPLKDQKLLSNTLKIFADVRKLYSYQMNKLKNVK